MRARLTVAAFVVVVFAATGCVQPSAPVSAATGESCAGRLPGAGEDPPPLPADQPVGLGVLIYRPCETCGAWLVTEDGRRYDIPPVPVLPVSAVPTPDASPLTGPPPEPRLPDPMFLLRLSPDGRWLLQPDNAGLRIRDLTGTTVRRVPGSLPWAWSQDGRWLFVTGPGRSASNLVDVNNGTTRPVRLQWGKIIGVLGPDEVVIARMESFENSVAPDQPMYAVVAPSSGKVIRELHVDVDANSWRPAVAGAGVLVLTGGADWRQVVVASLDDGRILARHTLPAETPSQFMFWQVAGLAGTEARLVRDRSVGSPSPIADPVELYRMDLLTGQRRLACTLPPRSEVITRG